MENLVKLVGKNIKDIRKFKNLTQEELAEKTGQQTSFLAGIERGDRNITLQTLEKIINGLNVDPKSIFEFSNLNIDENQFQKQELIDLLVNLLSIKSEEEIKLIYKVTKEIFETFNKR